jgi:hypothetical protein
MYSLSPDSTVRYLRVLLAGVACFGASRAADEVWLEVVREELSRQVYARGWSFRNELAPLYFECADVYIRLAEVTGYRSSN